MDTVEAEEGRAYDAVILQQPTTPFVRAKDLNAAMTQLEKCKASCCFTARLVDEPPRWMWTIDGEGQAEPLLSQKLTAQEQHSQNLPDVYFPTGAAWVIVCEALRQQRTVYADPVTLSVMPPERSVDVDVELDWQYAEAVAADHDFDLTE